MARSADTASKRMLRRVLWAGGGLAVLVYAVQGGEYSTTAIFSQKGKKAALEAEVAELEVEVDSLRKELKSLTSDPARIEQVAREKWGMVRGDKEILYWTDSLRTPSDSVTRVLSDSAESD